MRVDKLHRAVVSLFHVLIRLPQAVSLMLLTIMLAACVSQPKPVLIQENQEAAAPVTGIAEALKPVEPPTSASAELPKTPIPVPPLASGTQEPPTPTEPDVPVLEANPVVVTASTWKDASYSVPNATTATKTDTPIFDTPVNIQVIPRQVIDDQKTPSLSGGLKEVLENVSSIRAEPTLGLFNLFIVRGFRDPFVYRNGLLNEYSPYDTANLEQIEVLKGPAGVLFGRIQPGGLINLVTKKALAKPYYALEQQFGSYDFYRTAWDATGPLNTDRTLLYRFTGTYQNSESFRDFQDLKRLLIHPSVTWRPTQATEVSVDLEILRDDARFAYFGLPAIGARPAPISIRRSFQDPNDPRDYIYQYRLGFNLTHRLNDFWTIRNRFLASFTESDEIDLAPLDFSGDALRTDPLTGRLKLDRIVFRQGLFRDIYTTNVDLTGKLKLWNIDHEVLLGVDYFRQSQKFPFFIGGADSSLTIDVFNPVYGVRASTFDKQLAPYSNFSLDVREWYGVYFQDHITLGNKLHILAGGRHDWASVATGFSEESFAAVSLDKRTDRKFSPRVGMLYQPWQWLGVYGNWAQSFGSNNGRSAAGEALPPETGEQFEIGLKSRFFDDQLVATLAFYHLTKRNILTADLSTPDNPTDSVAIGEARSQGIELDIAGQLTRRMSVIGSYALTDNEITKNNDGLQGNRLANVPLHSGSLWLRYDFVETALSGLSLGFGMYAAAERDGDVANSFQLPGYVRLDASAAYRWKMGPYRLTIQLNVRNLLNKQYYENTDPVVNVDPRVGIYPGAPLTVVGSLRMEY